MILLGNGSLVGAVYKELAPWCVLLHQGHRGDGLSLRSGCDYLITVRIEPTGTIFCDVELLRELVLDRPTLGHPIQRSYFLRDNKLGWRDAEGASCGKHQPLIATPLWCLLCTGRFDNCGVLASELAQADVA